MGARSHAAAARVAECHALSAPPPLHTTTTTCSDISNNKLSGSIPETWASKTALKSVYMEPGNPGLCSTPPLNATFQLCVSGQLGCRDGPVPFEVHAETCYAPPPPPPSSPANQDAGNGTDSSSSGGGGSSFPVAAVAVPVAVVAAAALAGGLLLWRRQKRRQEQQAVAGMQGDKDLQARCPRVDSDTLATAGCSLVCSTRPTGRRAGVWTAILRLGRQALLRHAAQLRDAHEPGGGWRRWGCSSKQQRVVRAVQRAGEMRGGCVRPHLACVHAGMAAWHMHHCLTAVWCFAVAGAIDRPGVHWQPVWGDATLHGLAWSVLWRPHAAQFNWQWAAAAGRVREGAPVRLADCAQR